MQYLVEMSVCIALVATVITQVLIPGLKGMPFFPAFRSEQVEEAEKAVADALLDTEIARIRKRADRIRNSADPTEGETTA